jgi:hypothetical protein
MRELPILMNGAMVRAVLEGRKTVTRRLVKPQPFDRSWSSRDHRIAYLTGRASDGDEVDGLYAYTTSSGGEWQAKSPYGQPGDRLWVRETWGLFDPFPALDTAEESMEVVYRVHHHGRQPVRWRPSIHMPKEYARIWLEVTAVRVERLQDITEDQAKAEGCFFTDYGRECGHTGFGWTDVGGCPGHESTHPQRAGWMWGTTASHRECLHSARFAFGNLWNSTGGNWDDNPWVWVVEFRRLEKPHG